MMALEAVPGQIGQYAQFTVETCAYAGSGNVMKIQKLLGVCAEHLEDNNAHQAVAALGIALISMGEEMGADMSSRSFEHMLQYGEVYLCHISIYHTHMSYYLYSTLNFHVRTWSSGCLMFSYECQEKLMKLMRFDVCRSTCDELCL